ncbi:putative Coenzyme A biosynthesis bifunctional protein coaBC [Staphylococcus agnetis]|nr:putative Coenzyme A biosynthesis bifunctional protein coaBC [Staphylococcus agnetis]
MPSEPINDTESYFTNQHILITAGPTVEVIDPVRFVSNRASGKMGYAIAEALVARGAHVTLISGPTSIEPPQGVKFIPVQSAQNMFDAVLAHYKTQILFQNGSCFGLHTMPPLDIK